ncbi:MAG: DUF2608 domain-containing protein [Pseudomonadota bacterium]
MSRKRKSHVLGIIGFLLALGSLVAATPARALTEVRTDSIRSAEQIVHLEGQRYEPKRVLVILDVDSTLLTPYSDLGSSFWTSWQFALLKTPELEPEQVTTNLEGLYVITNVIRGKNLMRTVEPETAAVVNGIQKDGFPTIILTGQPPMMRKTAEWQLRENGMTFTKSAIGHDVPGTWKIGKGFDTADLTEKEIQTFDLTKPRDVSYRNGIFLVHDQHKGAMLRGLLHRLGLSDAFSAIVFVDDSGTNMKDMKAGFDGRPGLNLTNMLYTHEYPRIERFKAGDKWDVIAAFQQIRPTLPRSALAH